MLLICLCLSWLVCACCRMCNFHSAHGYPCAYISARHVSMLRYLSSTVSALVPAICARQHMPSLICTCLRPFTLLFTCVHNCPHMFVLVRVGRHFFLAILVLFVVGACIYITYRYFYVFFDVNVHTFSHMLTPIRIYIAICGTRQKNCTRQDGYGFMLGTEPSLVVEPGSNANRTSRTHSVTFGPEFDQTAEPEPVVRFGVRKNWQRTSVNYNVLYRTVQSCTVPQCHSLVPTGQLCTEPPSATVPTASVTNKTK